MAADPGAAAGPRPPDDWLDGGLTCPAQAARALRLHAAEQRCRELVLRSAACVDAGDAAGLAALFTADARLTRPGGALLHGQPAIAKAYADRPAGRITRHLVCGTLFDDIGEDQAQATSQVLVWTADAAGAPGPHGRPAHPLQRIGHFADRFVRTPDGWRISQRQAGFDLFSG
ncbi:nuclear transport factor 2 family protein [Acidovorax sp. FG27]|uniref:nuclear transport factor 2 family protein n=1 Tax=Acidovorax sp. FG27 TaxID=3133652 RepID=UPI00333FB0F8